METVLKSKSLPNIFLHYVPALNIFDFVSVTSLMQRPFSVACIQMTLETILQTQQQLSLFNELGKSCYKCGFIIGEYFCSRSHKKQEI